MADMKSNLRGAGLMAAGMASFAASDTVMKVLGGTYPLFQLLLLRGLGVMLLLGGVCLLRGYFRLKISPRDAWFMFLRVMGEVGAAWLFLTALFSMNYADALAILQALPLVVTLGAALFLGERLSAARIAVIIVGFFGVMVIIRPGGSAFSWYALLVVLSVISVALRDLASRKMSEQIPTVYASFIGAAGVTLSALIAAFGTPFVPMPAHDSLLLTIAVVGIAGGYVGTLAGVRVGDISFVAPFRYTSLLTMIIASVMVFGIFPDIWTLLGATIVVASGLMSLWVEQRIARALDAGARLGAG
ncbi:DMT family transporter [Ketogulonicigenium vulgare]|uniref:Membrane protein, putative n=1 Tax=Ketogulonicigenium vulgare (strain WSH-001) TaxID=759362 RepID=F9Y5E3_KETVW|nr:DMT family transporter [Ketogulonicigenium vulgare]ADO43679.1 membrane protein, putative [Ketogulonicigenium vulgare Y25]AEM41948.1 Membrane protein, putative [Ketogulonicigenium vulgare WSH-001]ALJ82049.1 hypothetical protein KVH_13275 [Ketogulonicigenium vulgare]ANW34678.1 hypothetical protein KvSKV_13185 [Ketogulonicigenium vulgare]AOZ55713.1 membrane protein, putative [Ketogulonicigenium vulgare]